MQKCNFNKVAKQICNSNFKIRQPIYLQAFNFIENRLLHRCFPMNIAKFLRANILKNICERLSLRKKFLNADQK